MTTLISMTQKEEVAEGTDPLTFQVALKTVLVCINNLLMK